MFINNVPFSVQFYILHFSSIDASHPFHLIHSTQSVFIFRVPHESFAQPCLYNWRTWCSQLPIEMGYFVTCTTQKILCYGNVCCFHLSSVCSRCFFFFLLSFIAFSLRNVLMQYSLFFHDCFFPSCN